MPDETTTNGSIAEDGFEYDGTFYRWRVSDTGKDLMLIDRFSGLPIDEFYELIGDDHERFRAPILLSLIACSIRAGRPEWSVERITRVVMALELSAVTFLSGDDEEEPNPESPLPELASETPPQSDAASSSTRNGSSRSSTQEDSSTFETSYATPV